MQNFREFVLESKKGRAWGGKLKNIDELLSWMYKKDILTKGEKNKKDTLFRKYYRYYNDGDLPRGYGQYNSNGYVPASIKREIEEVLEKEVEEFIKRILSKYSKKIDKKTFFYDKHIEELDTVLNVIQREDYHSLTTYWYKNVRDESTLDMIRALEEEYKDVDEQVNVIVDSIDWEELGFKSYEIPGPNVTLSFRLQKLKNVKAKIPKQIKDKLRDMKKALIEIEEVVTNLRTSIEKLKKLRALG